MLPDVAYHAFVQNFLVKKQKNPQTTKKNASWFSMDLTFKKKVASYQKSHLS